MSLREEKVLVEVAFNIIANSINVKWENRIIKEDEIISAIPHRKAYSVIQIDEFLHEVENAEKYVSAIGWNLNKGL
jgi:hypothetical protein